MSFSSPLEVGARLTSSYGSRWGGFHAGTDFGGKVAGTKVAVHAVAGGRVIRVARGNGTRTSATIPYHSGIAVVIDHGAMGGDRMYSYYGHLEAASVKVGQQVSAGEPIGIMGGSGARTQSDFAIHLHLGVFQNTAYPIVGAKTRGAPGFINPVPWLKSKGITVGSSSPVTPVSSGSSGSSGSKSSSGKHVVSNKSLTARLDKAGYRRRKYIADRIGVYQGAQLFGGLAVDKHWGNVTEAHFRWVRDQLQPAMNKWAGSKIQVDGDYRSVTSGRVREIMRRNHGGAYKGRIDGIPGPVFCKMLGIPTHPGRR